MARTVTVKIGADTSDFRAKLREAGQSVRQFRDELGKAAKAGHLDEVADGMARVGAVGVAAFGGVVMAAARFEKSMSGVNAATHASGREMDLLRQAALRAGKETSYSATQAADAITELSKASVSTSNILGGGLTGALSLAAAGQMDVAEAAEVAANAMTMFQLKGRDIPHIADLLAAGAGKAQGSVADMGEALKQSGLVAGQFGLSVEDTTGALAALANAGLIGSDAGTSLKSMIQSLQNPTKESRNLMQDLGIQVYDAQGKFVGLTNLSQQMKDKLTGLTQATRDQAMAQIFGSDGIRAATVLYREGSSGVQKWINAVDDSGYAADTARRQTDNLIGDLERLKGSLETLAIESGGGANGGLRVLAKTANALVDQFADLPPVVGGSVTVLAGLAGGAALLAAGWVKARRGTATFLEELRGTGPAGTRAATGLQKVTGAAGKAAAAFTALQVASMVVGEFQSKLNPQAEALANSLGTFATSGQTAGEMSRLLGGDLSKLDGQFQILADSAGKATWARGLQSGLESLIPGLDGTDGSLARTRERVTALDQALAQMVQGGQTDQAKKAFAGLAGQLAVNGVSMDEFKKQFPQYAAAMQVANTTTSDATAKTGELAGALGEGVGAQKEYASAADASAAAVRGERSALEQLSDQLKAETDPVFGLLDAEQKLAEAQKASADAIKEHGKNSAEAKEATRNLALAAIDLEGKAGALGSAFNGELTPELKSTLEAAGLTKGQIKDLAKQFRDAKKDGDKFSKSYQAEISLSGYGRVKGDLDKLLVYQQALKKGIPISAAQSAFNKNAYHSGGWTGPGEKYEPAGIVHADEFVIRKESRQKIERENPGLLDEMNATGQVRGYAGGGAVLPFRTSVSGTRVPSRAEVARAAGPVFDRDWPSSPSAQRGDSGVWRSVVALIKSTGPLSGEFGNAYRPGDPKWHGSGRAVDWMGYEQDALASFLASKRPLELIHRTKHRDYAYTRGVNKGSFNSALMEAHRNHVHIAMKDGGVINEHVIGVGRSGATYEFGENGPEGVTPLRGYASGGLVSVAPRSSSGAGSGGRLGYLESVLAARDAVESLTAALKENGRVWSSNSARGRDNRQSLIAGVRAAQQAAEAKFAETGSVRQANRVYADYIRQLDAAMKRMGVNAKARRELIKAYSEQPKYDLGSAGAASNSSARVKTVTDQMSADEALGDIRAAFAWTRPGFDPKTDTGRSELKQLFAFLSAAESAAQSLFAETGNSKSAAALYNSYVAQLRSLLSRSGMGRSAIDRLLQQYGRITLSANRWGGMYERASGGLREAQIADGGPTQYAWAEQSTGGEAFIPRLGDKSRSLAIWQHVGERWLHQPVWRPGAAGGAARSGPITVQATIPITLGSEVITRQVRIEVDAAVGRVVDAVVYETA
ncbi:phage tail tape measure protein [Actinoplanes siamensis]|uniref:Phage tail tape measure protein domain-containing protein n=1 Tax=Actinoplanes siamensis TaxID=1223317 RepID=A0A919NCL5_9ACTN|nr:phage tail tape measure protein [Actinoplanes siamensis]GIF08651.1 hypothetical protein Asi03nite_61890 [Actinoplanes siamensis]